MPRTDHERKHYDNVYATSFMMFETRQAIVEIYVINPSDVIILADCERKRSGADAKRMRRSADVMDATNTQRFRRVFEES